MYTVEGNLRPTQGGFLQQVEECSDFTKLSRIVDKRSDEDDDAQHI